MRTYLCAVLMVVCLCGMSFGQNQQRRQIKTEDEVLAKAEKALRKKLGPAILSITRTKENDKMLLVVEFAPPACQVMGSKAAIMDLFPWMLGKEPTAGNKLVSPPPPKAERWYTEKFNEATRAVKALPVTVNPKFRDGHLDGVKIDFKVRF